MSLHPGQMLLGKYKILELLGSGGWGEVYLAKDNLGRKVAIKCLRKDLCQDERALSQFLEEASKAASIKHPNVVIIYTCEREGDERYIVMEYGDKGTVAQLIAEKGSLPILQAVDLAIGVCRGLSAAHRKGLIHGDVRPSNIVLCTDEESEGEGAVIPKLSDFGFAQRALTRKSAETGAPAPLGAWQYVSPERLQGDPADGRSDLYSLGVSLYEMLTGEPPFPLRGDDAVDRVIRGHLRVNPEPPGSRRAGICDSLNETVMRALQKKPEERYPDARTMLKALEEARDAQVAWERKLQDLYGQAMAHFESGKWEEAVESFRKLLEYNAPYEDVPAKLAEAREQVRLAGVYQRALVFVAQKEWQKAKTELEDVLRSDPDYRNGEAKTWLDEVEKQIELASLYTKAVKQEKAKHWDEAIRLFSRILAIQPGYEDVPAKLNRAEERRRIRALYKEAIRHLDAGEWDEAIERLDEVVRLDPGYEDAASKLEWAKRQKELEPLYEQAVQYFEQENWTDAVELLDKVVAIDSTYQDGDAARKLYRARKQKEMAAAKQSRESEDSMPPTTEVQEPVFRPEQPVFDWGEIAQTLVIRSVFAVLVAGIITAILNKTISGLTLRQLLLVGLGLGMIIISLLIIGRVLWGGRK